MSILYSKTHKEIVGHVDGKSFRVLFDSDGYSDEVDDAVAKQLIRNKSATLVPDVAGDLDFSKANVPQLKKWAKDNGIDIGDATKKVELLAIIDEVQKAKGSGSAPQDPNENPGGDNQDPAQTPGGAQDPTPVV